MKKIVLIQPPIHPESLIFGTMDPYALEILAAGVRQDIRDVDVRIIDLRVHNLRKGLEEIVRFSPDIAGITGNTIDYPEMMGLFSFIKNNCPEKTLTVVGGHHATMVSDDFHNEHVDIIVKGAGIEALKEVASLEELSQAENIKGIVYRDAAGSFTATEPRNDIGEILRWPLPAYDLTKRYMMSYISFGHGYNVVTSASGCPFRCSFCACWKAFGGKYVSSPPETVLERLCCAPRKYIFFGDDLSFGNNEHANETAYLIKKAGIKKIYSAYCRADVIVKYPELIRRWRDIGLQGVIVGMESSEAEDLKSYNKKTSIETNHEANRILLDLGIHNYAHLMVKPSFKKDDFKKLSKYSLGLGVCHPTYSILTPLPATDMAQEVKERIITSAHQYYDLAHPVMDIEDSDIKEFYKWFKWLYFNNYSYSRWAVSRLKMLVNIISRSQLFPVEQARTPELISIPYVRTWINMQMKKTRSFAWKMKTEKKGIKILNPGSEGIALVPREKPFALLEARILTSFVRRMTVDPRKTLEPHIKKGMKVLDYGCGMGFFALPAAILTGASGKTVCIDINAVMLEELEKRAAVAGLSEIIETRIAEHGIPLTESDRFDLAISVAMIHEVRDAKETIDTIFRSLKPGGRFLLAEPKGHVSRRLFQVSADLCFSCGFRVVDYPGVSIHNSVLLEKPIF